MSATLALQLCLLVPAVGAAGIVAAGRWPNLRESVTLATAISLFACVLGVLAGLVDGDAFTF